MAKGSVNRVILLGNLGKDPEVRYTPNGVAITNISIATTEVWKDKQSGQNQEQTEWHRIVLFARLGEIAAEYLRKGSKVYIEGRIRTNKWQDKTTGQDRYMTEIIADNMQLLGAKGSTGSTPEMDGHSEKAGADASSAGATSSAAPADNFDDDIPF